MPSAPQPPAARHAPALHPPDPNRGSYDRGAHVARSAVHAEPAPAVVATGSHVSLHVLPRRLLGPLPENVANSDESRAGRRRLRDARAHVMRRVRRGEEGQEGMSRSEMLAEGSMGQDDRGRAMRAAARVRERVRREGEDEDEDEDDELDSDDGGKQRKDVWVGDSFDVGREFQVVGKGDMRMPDSGLGQEGAQAAGADTDENHPARSAGAQVGGGAADATSTRADERDASPRAGPSTVPSRPRPTPRSTQETFVTARTEFSGLESASSLPLDNMNDAGEAITPETPPRDGPRSIASSRRPLVSQQSELGPTPPDAASSNRPSHKRRVPQALAFRLKSALRKDTAPVDNAGAATIHAPETSTAAGAGADGARRPKTVQFPVEPARVMGDDADPDGPRKGNKPPAEPDEVLARAGEDAAGTSAGAVEEALDEEEDVTQYGHVVMRDRMLVRVAHHREESMAVYDEATQRRTPCDRSERLEEYLVVMRRQRIEFYQDWKTPVVGRLRGKRLCFLVPLEPSRSTLSVFNYTDMTISLTTSARKLHERLERLASSRHAGPMVARLRQSRQVQWIRVGKRGSHVFVLKLAERTRAIDWYWAIWRALGNELPARLDVSIPAFATTARLLVDEEATRQMTPARVVATIWDLMSASVDQAELTRERELNLELAWRGADGALDWLAWDVDVTGGRRDWALLASAAVGSDARSPRALELRNATHQPRRLVLEDGAVLDEPAGVEGYLVRHKTDAAPKEHVYVSVHAGAVYVCSMRNARPPLRPGGKGSMPPDLFADEYAAFVDAEHARCARLVAHAAGAVDLRDITAVSLGKGTSFVVALRDGHETRFDARTPAVAAEWVDALTALSTYWTRRHRVDARVRMDAAGKSGELVGAELASHDDAALAQVWDWCVIKGCREVTLAGRLFVKQGRWSTFRAAYVVLVGGSLVTFSIQQDQPFHRRHSRFPLFGAYVYSGMLAQDELREAVQEAAFAPSARVYQDGLQSTDGAEDTTLCVRVGWRARRAQPWELADGDKWDPPKLSREPPALLMCRARSKLERDRWVWAINAEMERQTRKHVEHGRRWREHGAVPEA